MGSRTYMDRYGAALLDDFNGDRWPDIAYSADDVAGVVVLLGTGDGSFEERMVFSTPQPLMHAMAAGDFNGDGHLDLFVPSLSYEDMAILFGNGNGTFQSPRIFLSNYRSLLITAATTSDLNGDGRSDLLVYHNYCNFAVVYLANIDGTLIEHARLNTGHRANLNAIATADFNHDGHTDIAVVNENARNIGVFLGDGQGHFSNQTTSFTGGALDPVHLAVGDFNSDRLFDLVFAYRSKYNVGLMFGHGNGSFGAPMKFYTLRDNFPDSTFHQVAVIDFNVDGHQDIIFHRENPDGIDILLGNGQGQFQRQAIFPVDIDYIDKTVLLVSDLNGDGCQDIVSLVKYPSAFDILLNMCGCRTVQS